MGSEASHIPVGRVERASYFPTGGVRVSQCQHVSLVNFNHDGNPRASAIEALHATAEEIATGSTARADLVASHVGAFSFCSPLTVDQAQSENHMNCILAVRP